VLVYLNKLLFILVLIQPCKNDKIYLSVGIFTDGAS